MGMEMLGMGLLMAGSAALSSHTQSRAARSQASAQKAATEEAKRNAEKQAEQQREQMRMQNQKTADISKILGDNTNDMLSGGQTMLTGAAGVDDQDLTLGKKSALG
jgi:hypothetical protein